MVLGFADDDLTTARNQIKREMFLSEEPVVLRLSRLVMTPFLPTRTALIGLALMLGVESSDPVVAAIFAALVLC